MSFKNRKAKFNKGLSVLEVLISALILLVLMSIASEIMYNSLRISREESGNAFIRKEAIKSITWLNSDLRRTHGASLLYNISPVIDVPVAISFVTTVGSGITGPGPTDVIASPKWENYVVYYLKADPKNPATAESTQKYLLKRRTVHPADAYYAEVFNSSLSTVKPLQSFDLINICNEPSGGDPIRIIARNIYQMDIVERQKNYFTISIETRDKNTRGGELKAVYTSRVLMRNTILQSH
jgi:hypothetical protein